MSEDVPGNLLIRGGFVGIAGEGSYRVVCDDLSYKHARFSRLATNT